jgi:hypothetical protein
MPAARRHLAAAVGFTLLAVVWSYPLALHLSTHLAGAGIGDNALFVWNFWWMRTALASGADFFHTTYLFAPVGADLTLHTHTALPAFAGATVLGAFPVVTALNLTILAALSLNGFCAYLLAWRITRDRGAAMIAGVIFGCSPYLAAHLNGHFNLTTAWTIPLFALALPGVVRGSLKSAVLCGGVLAVTAYIDYYYVVYEIALAVCMIALEARHWSLTMGQVNPYPRWLTTLVAVALLLDVIALTAIIATGGFSGQLGPIRLSMRDTFNPLQIFWVLAALAAWLRFRPRIAGRSRDTWSWNRTGRAVLAMFGTFVFAAAPLVWNGVRLLLRGQYVTQQYVWRNAPIGIDVATLFLGNPFHGIWGARVRDLYAGMNIDVIESGAWLGIAPVALCAYALRRKLTNPAVRQWMVVGIVFLVWALGSHVYAFGRNTGMVAPEALLRYVPLAANARMPGRAMVMVYLALAMLGAVSAAECRARFRRPVMALSAIAVFIFADFLAAPFPVAPVECPAIYTALRDRPERGALAELPLSLGDGFGALTPVDHRTLVCQMIHQRPMLGGVVARLPRSVLVRYNADPLIAAWLRMSGARADVVHEGPVPARELAGERLAANGIVFLILHRGAASLELREYVERVLPLTPVAEEGDRVLYVRATP